MILRPHHLLCINFFIGKGYNQLFIDNMQNIIKQLKENPKTKIYLNCSKDIICSCCNNLNNDFCISNEKVDYYDKKVLEFCNFEVKKEYCFDYLESCINTYILSKNLLSEICFNCSWFCLCNKTNFNFSLHLQRKCKEN